MPLSTTSPPKQMHASEEMKAGRRARTPPCLGSRSSPEVGACVAPSVGPFRFGRSKRTGAGRLPPRTHRSRCFCRATHQARHRRTAAAAGGRWRHPALRRPFSFDHNFCIAGRKPSAPWRSAGPRLRCCHGPRADAFWEGWGGAVCLLLPVRRPLRGPTPTTIHTHAHTRTHTRTHTHAGPRAG